MDNQIIESPKVEDEEAEVTIMEKVQKADIVADSKSPPPIIDYATRKIAQDARAKRKDEKTVQQVLKSLDNLKTPEEKLSAMCKKYSELLHENRQLQGTVKQSEKNIAMIHREKEQFRHERSKAVLAKERMEQLCRELQKLNKAQQEETALKLRVEEEKRKEISITFQSAFAEMNTLTNQNNEKSTKMREENLEMREKIRSVRERIESTETELNKVRQQAKLEVEAARHQLVGATMQYTAETNALAADKRELLMKLGKYHVSIKEHEDTERLLRRQIKLYEEKLEKFKNNVLKTTDLLKELGPQSRQMKQKKKILDLEKETALWKECWEKNNATVLQMVEIKEKQDAEMVTLKNKLSTLQELCKVFQRERASLLAQLREKNEALPLPLPLSCDENRESMKQVEDISNDCEKLKDNLSKLEGSFSEGVREAFKATVDDDESFADQSPKPNKKVNKKTKKNDLRNKLTEKKEEKETSSLIDSNLSANKSIITPIIEQSTNDQTEKSHTSEDNQMERCAAEIAILERHETVLKDIEKVLAEQAKLEAQITCVKETGTLITEANSQTPRVTSEIALLGNYQPEWAPINAAQLDIATPKISPENKTVEDDSGLSIADFEIVGHGSCIPDDAVFESGNNFAFTPDDDNIIDQSKLPLSLSTVDTVTILETDEHAEHVSAETAATADVSENSPIDATSSNTTIEKVVA